MLQGYDKVFFIDRSRMVCGVGSVLRYAQCSPVVRSFKIYRCIQSGSCNDPRPKYNIAILTDIQVALGHCTQCWHPPYWQASASGAEQFGRHALTHPSFCSQLYQHRGAGLIVDGCSRFPLATFWVKRAITRTLLRRSVRGIDI